MTEPTRLAKRLAEMLGCSRREAGVSCRLWILRSPPMLAFTVLPVTTAPLSVVSLPEVMFTVLPATCVLV